MIEGPLPLAAGSAAAFNDEAERYEAWYDTPRGGMLLDIEIRCVRPLMEKLARPRLEVGLGTGRFGEALGVRYGLDPSWEALGRAQARGIEVVLGVGEHLPFRTCSFGAVLVAFTLCFVQDPRLVLREIRRVLVPGGGHVLGFLPRGTSWADLYARRGAEGHPIYRTARFYAKEDVDALLSKSGLQIIERRSTLFQPPGLAVYEPEEALEGHHEGAGFLAVRATKPAA